MSWKHYLALAAGLLGAACGGSGPTTEGPAPDDSAADGFAALEQRLLDASYVELTARVRATGAVAAQLEGSLIIDGDRVLLGFEGRFAGDDVSIELTSDGATMAGGNGSLRFEQETPPALKQGLVLGITRMGILHNLAVLSTGNPPQGTYGNAESWVTVSDVAAADDTFQFAITVDGTPSATAKLTLRNGLPARREQTVQFPDGNMRVVEDYEQFTAR